MPRHTFGGRAFDRYVYDFRPDDAAGEGGGTDDRPTWLPDKFTSPEALAQSYSESEKELGRLRAEMERDRNQFAEALSALEQPAPAQQWNPQADPNMIAMNRAAEEGDMATVTAIQMQLNQFAVRQEMEAQMKAFRESFAPQMQEVTAETRRHAMQLAEQQVAGQFGDRWDAEIAPKLNQRLTDRPGLLPNSASVEDYVTVFREQANLLEAERIVSADRAREAERQAKLAAQTLDSSSARTPTDTDEKKAGWAEIAAAKGGGYGQLVGP